MTFGKILFIFCAVCLVLGTYGLVRNIKEKFRQRKQEKHYAEVLDGSDNE